MDQQAFDVRKYLVYLAPGEREQLIKELGNTGELTRKDIQWVVDKTVDAEVPYYKEIIEGSPLLRFIWALFQNRPDYLARALAQAYPEIFYSDGVASHVVAKLHTQLGHLQKGLVGGRKGGGVEVVYMKDLSKAVRQNVTALYREVRFLDFIYLMSRDPQVGFQVFEEQISAATTDFEQKVLRGLRKYCQALLKMKFPDVVSDIEGRLFPSFHVRWWIERVRNVARVLNVGGTSTHKTAFAVVGMHYYGCKRVLYVCPAHARGQMAERIGAYFKNPRNKVSLIHTRDDVTAIMQSHAEFTIVAYSTLIRTLEGGGTVADRLSATPFDGLVLDESHYINNSDGPSPAQRAKACHTLLGNLHLKRFMALSATPWENDPSELGEVASAIMPEVIPDAISFRHWGVRNEQFLREFLAHRVVGVDLRDITDLPDIKPKPWEDPFGVEKVTPRKQHRELYDFVLEDVVQEMNAIKKVARLLTAATQPHLLRDTYQWPVGWEKRFKHWQLSTKLVWLRKYITDARAAKAKVAVGTGMYVEGITRTTLSHGDDTIWVGKLLRRWFGEKHVLILDGFVPAAQDKFGMSPRDRLINQWRTDPEAWILLISMKACPDSVDLTLKKMKGVRKLWLTAIGFGWKPWTQFRSRFYREGQAYPIEYRVPILAGTIDEDLLGLNEAKLESMDRFLARSPITADSFFRLWDRYEAVRTAGLVSHPPKDAVQ